MKVILKKKYCLLMNGCHQITLWKNQMTRLCKSFAFLYFLGQKITFLPCFKQNMISPWKSNQSLLPTFAFPQAQFHKNLIKRFRAKCKKVIYSQKKWSIWSILVPCGFSYKIQNSNFQQIFNTCHQAQFRKI